jgi:hypothetical protein
MPFIDTPQGRFEGSQEQIDAYRSAVKAAGNPSRRALTPNMPEDTPDTTTGADFMTRFGASFKMTPEGKAGLYRDKYGDKNVSVTNGGEIMFRESARDRWKVADESQLTLRDLADFAGDMPGAILGALGAAGGTVAGAGVGSIPGAAIGAAAGNAIKQNVSNVLPGDDNMTPLARVGSMATDAAIGGASQGVAQGAVKLADLAKPHNLVASSALKAASTPYAQRGAQLSADTGIPMSFGEETGSKGAMILEGTARRNPVAADQFAAFDKLSRDAAVKRLNRVADDMFATPVDDISLGQSAQRGFDKLWDDLLATRRGQAASDFSAVENAAKKAGSPVLISTNSTKRAINDAIARFDDPAIHGPAQKAVAELKVLRDSFDAGVTPTRLNNLLQFYGKAAYGKGSIIENLDNAQQRKIAGDIHGALNRDLDRAVAQAEKIREAPTGDALRQFQANPEKVIATTERGDVASLLRTARDNYAKNSAAITETTDSVIGRYLGGRFDKDPTDIAEKLVNMRPTTLRTTFNLLKRADPELADQTARYVIERSLTAAKPSAGQSAGGQITFSAARFLNSLPDERVLETLLSGKPALGEFKKTVEALQRVANRPMEGSPTGPMMMAWDLMKGLFTLNPHALAGLPAAILAPRAIAAASLTPQGRQALITVSKTGPVTKQVTQAMNYLAGISLAEQKQSTDEAIATAGSSAAK